MMKTYRVIQFGAGNTGKFVLGSILGHPSLQLFALGVNSLEKAGRDAGEFCRLPPTGVLATRDIDALLSQEADCVCFMPTDPHAGDVNEAGSHAAGLFALLCRFLESGKNVIATAPNMLVHAPALEPAVRERIEQACARGRSSFQYVGVSPGFMPDRLVLNLTAISSRIDAVSAQEIMNYGAYDDRAMLFDFYGFGGDPAQFDAEPMRTALGRSLGGSVAVIAAGLEAALQSVQTDVTFAVTTEDFKIRTGIIQAGTIGAVRITASGYVNGAPRIVVEHITRVGNHVAPDWPRFGGGNAEGYRIAIRGAPSMSVDVELGAFGRNPMADAGWAVAGLVCNSIADLCEAPSGIRSCLDMPSAKGRYRLARLSKHVLF